LTALPKGTTGLRCSIRSTGSSTPLPVWGPLAAAVAVLRGDGGERARAWLEVACVAYLFARLRTETCVKPGW